jgi:D-beta-D-heptose 7-phosphate kinase/D-beta-D-heptose 1-phosphate adenosyltransferase
MVTVCVAGAFDPVHRGHIRHLQEARGLGDRLVVLLNPDRDLLTKKGFVFMTWQERWEILMELRAVDAVIEITDLDGTCAGTLAKVKPDLFAKGGDRGPDNMPQSELDICEKLGIQVVYGVGGGKIQSSSELVRAAAAYSKREALA